MELIQEFFDHRDGKFVLDCALIERPVVDTEAPCVVRFLDEDRRREGRGAAPDEALFFHGATLAFQLVFLQLWISVGAHGHRRSSREVDGVIPGAGRWQAHQRREDVREFFQQEIEQVVPLDGTYLAAAGARHAAPAYASVGTPQVHGVAAEVLEDQAQRGQPIGAEHHDVLAQG